MGFLLINAVKSRLAGIQFNCPDIDDAEKFSNSSNAGALV